MNFQSCWNEYQRFANVVSNQSFLAVLAADLVVVRNIDDLFDAGQIGGQRFVSRLLFLLRLCGCGGWRFIGSIASRFIDQLLFVNGLLESISRVNDFRPTAEVDLQLLRAFQISFAATTERQLEQSIDFQLLQGELLFLFANRGRLFAEQCVFLLDQVCLPEHQRNLLFEQR